MAISSTILAVFRLFLAPSISKLIELARSLAASGGHHMKIQALAEELEQIKSMVDDAASTGFVDDVLWLFRDAIHDAEELLSRFRYESANANQTVKSCGLVATVGANISLNRLKNLLDDLLRLHRSLQELHVVSQRRAVARPITDPLTDKGKFFGYSEEYTTLLSSLVPDEPSICGGTTCSGGDTRVVAIVGRGGTGKTELARWVFNNDEKVRANFDLLIWVCVYAKFTEADLLTAIWRSVAGADADAVGEMNITSLQHEVTEKVRSAKRYLLVLDDVCNDESTANELSRRKTWASVLAPFKQHGDGGSRILVTTRAKICSDILNAGTNIVLDGISTDAMTLLLKKKAFRDEHANIPGDLQEVLHNNVGKLHGSPLAAEEVVHSFKDRRNITSWKESLNKDHHTTHLSSYHDLSPHLKRCFAFCSIFPRKWEFEPEKLVKMWLAHSFVVVSVGPNRITREENMAKEYFDALVRRSLFQESDKGKDRYVIHEEIHSMLRHVAPRYYLSIDGPCEAQKVPVTVRHLSVTTDCVHQLQAYPSGWLKKLRTLLVYKQDKDDYALSTSQASMGAIDNKMLKNFKGVRVLDLSDTGIAELPESMNELTNLRYLDLPNTIKELGPHGVSRMINLRYLHTNAQIAGIHSMEKLEGSIEFHADVTKEGRRMSELQKLNSLRGTLSIKGLETVKSKKEAKRAHLADKKHLQALKIEWGHWSDHQANQSAILHGLQPHPNLQELHITRYQGKSWPAWLTDARALENLRSLYLRNCRQLETLPLVGQLPRLEVLFVEDLVSVVRIDSTKFCYNGASFRSLRTLVLKDMENLVAWDMEPAPGGEGTGSPILFRQLTKVEILHCPKLRSFSGLLCCRTSLTYLRLERCPEVTAPFTRTIFPSLMQQNLHIHECANLKHFME